MAAAAATQPMLKHHILDSNAPHFPPSKPHDSSDQEKRELNFVAHFTDNGRVLSPAQIAEDPRHKALGGTSKALRLQDFELMKTLGTGTFARVWLSRIAERACLNKQDTEKVYALKILRKVDIIRLKQVEHVRNERSTLGAVAGHPFITTLITTFSDHDSLYMLLDYCPGGEIFTYLRRRRRFDEPTARFYTAEIVLILEFLHEKLGIAYRDLKPENILLDGDGHLKLVDFGFAKQIGKMETYTLCGTPEYLAPEVIRNTGHGTPVDWWALGILLYEFLVGQPPFWDQNPMNIYSKIVEGHIRFPTAMSSSARSLITSLCTTNPSERLGHIAGGSDRVKDHPFFSSIDWDALYHRRMKGPIVPRIRGPADASNFDNYDPPGPSQSIYTAEMEKEYENAFADF